MTNDEWSTPTDAEQEAVTRAAVNAAFECLEAASFDWSDGDAIADNWREALLCMMRAFEAIEKTPTGSSYAERKYGASVDKSAILASVLAGIREGLEPDEIHPPTIGAQPFLLFAHVSDICTKKSDLIAAIDFAEEASLLGTSALAELKQGLDEIEERRKPRAAEDDEPQ